MDQSTHPSGPPARSTSELLQDLVHAFPNERVSFGELIDRLDLRAHGVAPRGPASVSFGAEGSGWSLYIADPDGNAVELKGPATS